MKHRYFFCTRGFAHGFSLISDQNKSKQNKTWTTVSTANSHRLKSCQVPMLPWNRMRWFFPLRIEVQSISKLGPHKAAVWEGPWPCGSHVPDAAGRRYFKGRLHPPGGWGVRPESGTPRRGTPDPPWLRPGRTPRPGAWGGADSGVRPESGPWIPPPAPKGGRRESPQPPLGASRSLCGGGGLQKTPGGRCCCTFTSTPTACPGPGVARCGFSRWRHSPDVNWKAPRCPRSLSPPTTKWQWGKKGFARLVLFPPVF